MIDLAQLLCGVAAFALALPALYLGVLSVAAVLPRTGRGNCVSSQCRESPSIAVLIPAHNEEKLIGDTLRAVFGSVYPQEKFQVFVIADNCSDGTCAAAESCGATVAQRSDLLNRGKGYALDWFIRGWKESLQKFNVIAVVDADTIVDPYFLAEVGRAIGVRGGDVVQGYYGVANLESGWRASLAEVAFAVSHHLRPLGRNRLGASAGLKGNGMAFRSEVLLERGWPAHSIVEDLEFGLLLLREGIRIEYLPEARVFAEMVTDPGASDRQRVRWEGGRFQILRQEALRLLVESVRRRDLRLVESLIDLICPPLGLYSGFLIVVAGIGVGGRIGVLWGAASFCLAVVCLHVLLAMWHRGVTAAVWRSLLVVPFFLLRKIPVYLQLSVKGAGSTWVRTLRNGECAPPKYKIFAACGRGNPKAWLLRDRCNEMGLIFYARFAVIGKRIVDILGSLGALCVLSPVMLLAALLIKLEDGGPVLFRQVRIGLHGQRIQIFKFRSMRTNAERVRMGLECSNQHEVGVTFKMRRDPRVTRIGRLIRKYSIDEMPQFLNVLRGDMALVGPRPALPREVACYNATQLRRLIVKPGISCLWQIQGRADIDFEGQVRLDLEYIHKFSILRDIVILVKTIPAVLQARGAY